MPKISKGLVSKRHINRFSKGLVHRWAPKRRIDRFLED